MTWLVVVLVLLLLPLLWAVFIYNRFVRFKSLVEEAWSGIDVQLKRRSDLIPQLVETVKGYKVHEQDLLRELTELRSRTLATQEPAERGRLEGAVSRLLGNLFAVAEAYPDLKANTAFLELQDQLAEIEDQIQLSRRYYNGTVRNLNIAVDSFPSNIVARLFAFIKAEYFELDDPGERAVPKVAF